MANSIIKNYGLSGVHRILQFGKRGPKLIADTANGTLSATTIDGATLTTMSGANATSGTHFITKSQLDSVYTEATFFANVNYNDSSPILLGNISSGIKTIITTFEVDTVFNANAVVTVGDSSNNGLLLNDSYAEVEVTGTYQTINTVEFAGNTALNIYVTQGGATQGAGTVLVSVVDGPVVDGGTINYGEGTSGIALIDLSVTSNSPSGNGSLTYSNTTGVFTFTPADASLSNYSNSDVVTLLNSFGSNSISTTGNITAAQFIGNGSLLTGVTSTTVVEGTNLYFSNARVNAFIQSDITTTDIDEGTNIYYTTARANTAIAAYQGNINTAGNIEAAFFIGNGSLLTGIAGGGSYTDANVITLLGSLGNTISSSANITTTANVTTGILRSTATIFGNVDVVLGDTANASTAKTRLVSFDTSSYIQTGNGTIGSTGNIVFSPYSSSDQIVVINTASGNITALGTVTANNFIGNISITGNVVGTSQNVSLVAGSFTATFDNTGKLTLPSMGGDEGGEINLEIPATNTTLQNRVAIDVFQDRIRFFEGSANVKGAYIDLSQAGTGVGTLLNNRVSGFVNAGTFVTMDLIKATVTTGGNRGLSLATTTGTLTYNIGGTYGYASSATAGGFAASSQSLTTTPTTSIFGWSFPGTGDMSTYILTDTTNSRAYRITLMMGASFNNNMISIERLI